MDLQALVEETMAFNKERIASRRRNRIFVKEFAKIVSERAAKGAKIQLPGGSFTPGLKRQLEKLAGQDVVESIEGDTSEPSSRKRRRSSQTEESEIDSEFVTQIKSESEEEEGIRELGDSSPNKVDEFGLSLERRADGHQSMKKRPEDGVAEQSSQEEGRSELESVEVSQEPENRTGAFNQSPVCQLCGREYRYKKPHLMRYHPAKLERIDPTGKLPRREFNLKMDAMLMGIDLTKEGDGTFEEGEDENWVRPEHRIIHKPILPRLSLAPTSMPVSAPVPAQSGNLPRRGKGRKKAQKKPTVGSLLPERSSTDSNTRSVSTASTEHMAKPSGVDIVSNVGSASVSLNHTGENLNELDGGAHRENTLPHPVSFAPPITPAIMAQYPKVAVQQYPQMAPLITDYPLGNSGSITSQSKGAVGRVAPNATIMPRPVQLGPMSRSWDPRGNESPLQSKLLASSMPLSSASRVLIPRSSNLTKKTPAKASEPSSARNSREEIQKPTDAPKVIPESWKRLYEDPFAQADATGS